MANENLVVPRFYVHTIPNEAKSKDEGRPMFDELEVCELRFSGNRQTIGVYPAHEVFRTETPLDGPVTPVTYAMEYNQQYLAFKNNEAQDLSGTPLSELPFLTQSKRLELKALNIHTAEALASIDGQPLKQLGMKGREMKNQAQAYIDAASGSSNVTALAAENVALKDQLDQLRDQVMSLTEAAKAAPKAVKAPEPEPGETADDEPKPSPFDDFEDDDIRNWIQSTSGEDVDKRLGRKKLLAKAEEINEGLKPKDKVEA